ncbi:hypothetical protein DAEQUDRAFT_241322 [Daedalea quercina L-15889]|uniref:Uncharacterized protein n=1 Tax=Daedalea quercina L-15889 TaxID=1314783 RepID=A0A165QR01_9APHY|nr:hypothetical protein DAEQUDRAFT_241322 [Daedalea quercina L-15889]
MTVRIPRHDVGHFLLLPATAGGGFLRLGEQTVTRSCSSTGTLLPNSPCRRHARPDLGQTPNANGRRAGRSPDLAGSPRGYLRDHYRGQSSPCTGRFVCEAKRSQGKPHQFIHSPGTSRSRVINTLEVAQQRVEVRIEITGKHSTRHSWTRGCRMRPRWYGTPKTASEI